MTKHADHYNRNLACPACGKKSRFKIWDRIYTDKVPELKDQVRDLSLFHFVCPACGQETYLDYDFLYVQNDVRLVIYYAPGGGDISAMHESLQKPEYAFMQSYQYRLIRTRARLLETLAIFDAALDDRVLEIMKVMLRSWLAAQAEPIHADLVEFTFAGGKKAFHFADTQKGNSGILPFEGGVEQTYKALAQDLEPLLAKEETLTFDQEWAVSFVQQHQDLFA